jgi:hypothetical protein
MGRKVKTSEPRQGTSMLMLLVLCSSSYVLQPRNLFGQRVEPVGVQAMRSPSRGIIVSAARNAGDIARDSVMSHARVLGTDRLLRDHRRCTRRAGRVDSRGKGRDHEVCLRRRIWRILGRFVSARSAVFALLSAPRITWRVMFLGSI